ncbi:uncharacterized protein LOC125679446 [Ostrea edulis]|uniref:uncharacterized protein LOC125679446 n=1 Tax=Ostrea edulis TaxID=37623 RepID=UPI0024AED68E|nr:uncharacterized protein LOC125679446 [Ostrea edulis]
MYSAIYSFAVRPFFIQIETSPAGDKYSFRPMDAFKAYIEIYFNNLYTSRGLRFRRVSNNSATHNSDEPQEDYSQMTRASNSYNVLSFDRRNAISTFNATEEEDIYDEGGAVLVNRNDYFQDRYVTFALQWNQRMIAVEFEKSAYSSATKTADDKDDDSYVTLAVNDNEATGDNSNGTSNSLLMTAHAESSDTYDDTLPFHSHYYMLNKQETNIKT